MNSKQAKEITDYILVNNINVDYINIKAVEENGDKAIEIFDTDTNCYVIFVDRDYNIIDKQ